MISFNLLLTCFAAPLDVAFHAYYLEYAWFNNMNALIDFVFLTDIIVNFFTAYENESFQV